jgi:hypothetical protein
VVKACSSQRCGYALTALPSVHGVLRPEVVLLRGSGTHPLGGVALHGEGDVDEAVTQARGQAVKLQVVAPRPEEPREVQARGLLELLQQLPSIQQRLRVTTAAHNL